MREHAFVRACIPGKGSGDCDREAWVQVLSGQVTDLSRVLGANLVEQKS